MPARLLLHLFRSHRYQAYVSKHVVGSTRKEISIHHLRRFEVPIVPANVAKSFLETVEKIENAQRSVDIQVQHLVSVRTQIINRILS
jgi:restriction endonuclease S subunit